MYKCPQCGHTSEQAGSCPTCNVPMSEVAEGGQEGGAAPTMPQEPQAPEAPASQ